VVIATVVAAVLIAVGIAGVVIPVLPGLPVVVVGIAVWAVPRGDTVAWIVLGVAVAIAVIGSVVQYLLPGQRLRRSGVPTRAIAVGALLGVVGFFVVPVVGLFLGFVLGVYLMEMQRLGSHEQAWPSTRHALVAVGWSILIELATALLAAALWAGAVIFA
jgi:uncharacterized protein YqgC (DUF456 family)